MKGWVYMCVFIAGQRMTGVVDGNARSSDSCAVRTVSTSHLEDGNGGCTGRLSHRPEASLARKSAEHGATTTRSAHLLSCGISTCVAGPDNKTHLDVQDRIAQFPPVLLTQQWPPSLDTYAPFVVVHPYAHAGILNVLYTRRCSRSDLFIDLSLCVKMPRSLRRDDLHVDIVVLKLTSGAAFRLSPGE